jgi:hypothetical protein
LFHSEIDTKGFAHRNTFAALYLGIIEKIKFPRVLCTSSAATIKSAHAIASAKSRRLPSDKIYALLLVALTIPAACFKSEPTGTTTVAPDRCCKA